jgi:hypothetical protein
LRFSSSNDRFQNSCDRSHVGGCEPTTLHALNTGNHDAALANFKPLIERHGHSARVTEIQVRHSLLTYQKNCIDQLLKLVSVGLADSGLDDCGFSSFEFQAGWDRTTDWAS